MDNKGKLLDHEYDGIRELDNPLPGWWLLTFYGAVVFSVVYFSYYHFGGEGKDPQDELAQDLEIVKAQQIAAVPESGGGNEDILLAALKDPGNVKKGQQVFGEKCASCHGSRGEGSIGPNLADKYWLHHRGKIAGIYQVIADGVLDKGMPPWKTMLKPEELVAVSVFVKSLNGTNPANAKAPQGEEVKGL